MATVKLVYTHYDDYRPPITGHLRDSRLFEDFLMASTRLFEGGRLIWPYSTLAQTERPPENGRPGIVFFVKNANGQD